MARSWVASLALESSPGSSKFLGLQGGGCPGRNVLVGSGRVPGVVVCIVLGSGRSEECTSDGREKSTPAVGLNPGGGSIKESAGEEPSANSTGSAVPCPERGRRLPGLEDRRHGDEGTRGQPSEPAPPQPGTRREILGASLLWLSGKRDF